MFACTRERTDREALGGGERMLWHVLQLLLSNDCHVLQYTSFSRERHTWRAFMGLLLALHAKIIMMIAILQHKYVQFAFGI